MGQTAVRPGDSPGQAATRRVLEHASDPASALGPYIQDGCQNTVFYGPYSTAIEATAAERSRLRRAQAVREVAQQSPPLARPSAPGPRGTDQAAADTAPTRVGSVSTPRPANSIRSKPPANPEPRAFRPGGPGGVTGD